MSRASAERSDDDLPKKMTKPITYRIDKERLAVCEMIVDTTEFSSLSEMCSSCLRDYKDFVLECTISDLPSIDPITDGVRKTAYISPRVHSILSKLNMTDSDMMNAALKLYLLKKNVLQDDGTYVIDNFK